MNLLMVAAENDALPAVSVAGRKVTGKVGGVGDVVRGAPRALAARGCGVSVVTPAYGAFTKAPGCVSTGEVEVEFAGNTETLRLYSVASPEPVRDVRHFVVDHPQFAVCGAGRIYCDDPPDRPFARDATKFALFCTAVAAAISRGLFGKLDVLHLHDWHTAFLLILRRYHSAYRALKRIRCVYTIHNVALQGIRPFAGDESSFEVWFPGLRYQSKRLRDPRWTDCINPAAAAIRLADAVHAVSPSYAEEILRPSAVASHGRYGGEGLEQDLSDANRQGRLFGILNGCEYPPAMDKNVVEWNDLVSLMRDQVLRWACHEAYLASTHFLAHLRLGALSSVRPDIIVTSVGRVTEQKLGLLRRPASDGRAALTSLLEQLGNSSIFLLLGSGDEDYERFIVDTAAHHPNLIFLNGYSDGLAQALYGNGDLFLMPSAFEPCGISQMLAMRAGQPCLVHGVGGLRDTVEHGVTGFAFSGDGLTDQADRLITTFQHALDTYRKRPARWRALRNKAKAARFGWETSAEAYLSQLYGLPGT